MINGSVLIAQSCHCISDLFCDRAVALRCDTCTAMILVRWEPGSEAARCGTLLDSKDRHIQTCRQEHKWESKETERTINAMRCDEPLCPLDLFLFWAEGGLISSHPPYWLEADGVESDMSGYCLLERSGTCRKRCMVQVLPPYLCHPIKSPLHGSPTVHLAQSASE